MPSALPLWGAFCFSVPFFGGDGEVWGQSSKLLTEGTILARLRIKTGLLDCIAVPMSSECAARLALGLTGGAGSPPKERYSVSFTHAISIHQTVIMVTVRPPGHSEKHTASVTAAMDLVRKGSVSLSM